MSFVVSARKYRPRRFEDVVGQAHVSQTLKKALQTDHLAHAFLFCGPRGVGKTTCARILAMTLNCRNPTSDFEPCGECDNCKAFAENASFNIMELDAASNNSVENIRTLVEQVRFQPQQGKYKVFIIDEVHMLSQAAFNAFLKTLEEPPSYAIFILATTEKHKIIPTILSRCQIFDFKRIQVKDVVEHLKGICKLEGIEADTDALHVIGQKADGALRDALSIFDRIVSSSGKRITYEDVISNLNVLDYDYFFRIADGLLGEDLSKVLLIFDEIFRNGFEGDLFINGLAEHLRNVLVCKDENTLRLLEVSETLRERYRQQAAIAPSSFLLTCINLANDCDINYKMARHKRLHVEMTLIKMCFAMQTVKVAVGSGQSAVGSGQLAVGSGVEKKTADGNVGTQKASIPEKKAVEMAAPPVAILPKEEKTTLLAITQQADYEQVIEEKISAFREPEPLVVPKPAPAPDPPKTVSSLRKFNTGGPSLVSLDDLHAEVKEAETNGIVHEAKLTQADLEEAWELYATNLDKDSVRSMLKNTVIKMESGKVTALVTSALAENTIRQETGLMEFLREQLHAPRLAMEIKVDSSKMASYTPAPKPLTDSEKYWRMKSANPMVDELRKRFDLQFENS